MPDLGLWLGRRLRQDSGTLQWSTPRRTGRTAPCMLPLPYGAFLPRSPPYHLLFLLPNTHSPVTGKSYVKLHVVQRHSQKREDLRYALSAMHRRVLANTWRTWQATNTEQQSSRRRMEAAVSLLRARILNAAYSAWLVPTNI